MKKFARIKSYDEIKAQCQAQGLELNDKLYREHHWDTIVITSIDAKVVYSTFNGRFYGTAEGVEFDSSSTEHENEPWFQALLSFFYVEV